MANQLHGLESEAQRTAGGQPQISSQRSKDSAQLSTASSSEASLLLPVSQSAGGLSEGEAKGDEVDGGVSSKRGEGQGGGEGDSEEEKFFDAHEISAEEWAKSTKAEFLHGDPSASTEEVGGPAAADRPPLNGKPMELVSIRVDFAVGFTNLSHTSPSIFSFHDVFLPSSLWIYAFLAHLCVHACTCASSLSPRQFRASLTKLK